MGMVALYGFGLGMALALLFCGFVVLAGPNPDRMTGKTLILTGVGVIVAVFVLERIL